MGAGDAAPSRAGLGRYDVLGRLGPARGSADERVSGESTPVDIIVGEGGYVKRLKVQVSVAPFEYTVYQSERRALVL